MSEARVISINVARATSVRIRERTVQTAIDKQPVNGLVEVLPMGLAGDEQADLSVHGGASKAVYAYPHEHYAFWETVRKQSLRPEGRVVQPGLIPYPELAPLAFGAMGENLSIKGLDEKSVWIGDRLRIGSAEFVVTEPRIPCFKFNAKMGFNHASKLMVQSGYCGFYLAVMRTGQITAGDTIELVSGDRDRAITIAQSFALRTAKSRDS
ncbi:MAG TPA: MOSC domain-containing protein [Burkholderiaceae bacterium]|nr:MOSC domain-containing protein [Burkholderiaceae bacterium]